MAIERNIAPNGKPSNLSPSQYALVRTATFKKWFGDWEKAAKISAMQRLKPVLLDKQKTLTQKEAEFVVELLKAGENKIDGRKTTWIKSSVGKILRHKGFDSSLLIPRLKEVFDESIPMADEQEEQKEGHKLHPNFVGYHHYVGKIKYSGVEYYVRFTLQEVRIKRRDLIPNQFHSTFVSEVKIYSTDIRINTGNTPAIANVSAMFVDAKLRKFFEDASQVSKIVDENGEPLVVEGKFVNMRNPYRLSGSIRLDEVELRRLVRGLEKEGYDGILTKDRIIVFNPRKQLKTAES